MYNFDEFCRSYLKDRIKVMQTLTKNKLEMQALLVVMMDEKWNLEEHRGIHHSFAVLCCCREFFVHVFICPDSLEVSIHYS